MTAASNRRSSLLSSEDWVACWLGFALVLLALAGLRPALPGFSWDPGSVGSLFTGEGVKAIVALGALLMVLAGIGVKLMGGSLKAFGIAFPAVFLLGWLAQFLAGHAAMKAAGVTYVITGLFIGLFISNVLRVPRWLQPAARTEYYIKTGLVVLGSNILIGDILQAGALGIAQALLVILVIWYVCFW
ncbi:MAG: hypothetical protein OXB91_10345, partial [Bryobacterales bacterium]|nr:hypothetical protein [Bryobacterales bacterium]